MLGDLLFPSETFSEVDDAIRPFTAKEFAHLSSRKRFRQINETLAALILKAPHKSFLLSAVLDYFDRIDALKILPEPYHFSQFEFWLNHFSKEEDQALIRGKIAGKYLPREEYQSLFPIGMGNIFQGTHFVAAHLSPDVDTTIASFFGWLDALAARVGSGQHLWSLPGGPPESPITEIFKELFGQNVFAKIAKTETSLALSAMDLLTQTQWVKKSGECLISALDHGVNETAIILVDANGHYLGDWRSSDVEPVRQVIILFKSCVRWFENHLHVQLISLFAKQDLHESDIPGLISSVYDVEIATCDPVLELDEKQKRELNALLTHVFKLPKGLSSTFSDLSRTLELESLKTFREELQQLQKSELFDSSGKLVEDRPKIFHRFQRILNQLDKAIHRLRDHVERLDIAVEIKHKVLGKKWHYLTLKSDVEDIRIKINHYNYLTVVIPEEGGKLFPVGVVWAHDLRKSILGTVSFRDFCNSEEVKMAPYLSVISVIDHHKSQLNTTTPPLALIGDAQSCNVLVAEAALALNSHYRKEDSYFVHPLREIKEYLCFLHAILDDTDLLTKVTQRDVRVVANLLNLLKSLTTGQEVEMIRLQDIPKDHNFAKNAARRILQNEEMYSLYSKVYASKEAEVAESLHSLNIFQDTKEQNGCCRVGQIKLFTSNYPLFLQQRMGLEKLWRETSEKVFQSHPELDLHLQMVSTIASAQEVYEDRAGSYSHRDELWFWIPKTELAQRHLASFLSAFQKVVEGMELTLELPGDGAGMMEEIFSRNFLPIPIYQTEGVGRPLAILTYPAGAINSRKAMITPNLPKL